MANLARIGCCLLFVCSFIAGCGPSAEEIQARKDAARAMEQQAQRKAQEERARQETARKEEWKEWLANSCRESLKQKLKDPFSYNEISAKVKFYDKPQPAKFVGSTKLWGEYNYAVVLDYTASNSYGANIRDDQLCLFYGNSVVYVE